MIAGDYTGIAETYQRFRVGYSDRVLSDIAALLPVDRTAARVLDVGAGTGIWTRQLAAFFGRCTALEPNDDMRRAGQAGSGPDIHWKPGRAEDTGEPGASCHWITMASSFHWTDVDAALAEFHRVLKPEGLFTCLWNPRVIEGDPLLERIEAEVERIAPRARRRSSGSGNFVKRIAERLARSRHFEGLAYHEDRVIVRMSRDRYLGLWRSVNDIRAIAGERAFADLMTFIESATAPRDTLDCPYLTRAWTVRRSATSADARLLACT